MSPSLMALIICFCFNWFLENIEDCGITCRCPLGKFGSLTLGIATGLVALANDTSAWEWALYGCNCPVIDKASWACVLYLPGITENGDGWLCEAVILMVFCVTFKFSRPTDEPLRFLLHSHSHEIRT